MVFGKCINSFFDDVVGFVVVICMNVKFIGLDVVSKNLFMGIDLL